MELSVTLPQQSQDITSLKIIQKIAQGKCSIYQAFSSSSSNSHALKLFPKTPLDTIQYNKEKVRSKLSHPNVIQYIRAICHMKDFHIVMTEFCERGSFYKAVSSPIMSTDILVRTYFYQLIDGLAYIHSQDFVHLDLKLSSLVFGSDFSLKIIDFDQSQQINGFFSFSRGTKNYRAPEMRSEACQNPPAADIFSVGIILYLFKTRKLPFHESKDSKDYFLDSFTTFWRNVSNQEGENNVLSEDFTELINGILHNHPKMRFKIEDVKCSKWYNGPIFEY